MINGWSKSLKFISYLYDALQCLLGLWIFIQCNIGESDRDEITLAHRLDYLI